jgi:ubiquinol-cytochrome c reductase cytochrome b subunit
VWSRRLAKWLDDRLGAASFAKKALDKVFPDHWSFMLGEVALYCFLVLVATGVFLTFFFEPSLGETTYRGSYRALHGVDVSNAYDSVLKISFDTRAGLVIRQAHHWAAILFVAVIVLHLSRVFFTGAFRKPREINWVIGVTLLLLAVANGFTGYSLPDDLLSGTGLRIAYSLMLSLPLVGSWLAFLVFGGEFPADSIISRLYTIHTLIIPVTLGLLLAGHLALVWHQKHTQFRGPGRTEHNVVGSRLWPTYAAKSVGLLFIVAAVAMALGGLVQINPVWLYGPYDPASVSSPAQPDWYLGWTEGAVRLFPPWEVQAFNRLIPNPFFPGILLPGLTFLILYLWPFLETWLTADHQIHNLLDLPRDHPVRNALGATTLSFYSMLGISASNDLIAASLNVDVSVVTNVFRVLVLVVPALVGFATYAVLKGLKRSKVKRVTRMPARALLPGYEPPGRRDVS